MIYLPTHSSHTHWQVAQKLTHKPKLAKEYVFPAHGLTEKNKARAHNRVDGR